MVSVCLETFNLPWYSSILSSGLWSLLAVGIFLFGEQAECSLHATFEGLCYCSIRLPPMVCTTLYNVYIIMYYYLLTELWRTNSSTVDWSSDNDWYYCCNQFHNVWSAIYNTNQNSLYL